MAKQNSSGWLDQFVSKVPKTFGKEVAKTDATTQSKPGPVFLGNPYAKEMAKRQTYLNPKGVSASDAMRQAAKDRIAKEKADAFTRELAETAQTVGAGFELASPFLGPLAPITAAVGAGFGIGSSAYLAAKDAAAGNYSSAALNAGFGALDAAGLAALRNAKLKDFVQGADNVSDFQQVVDLTDVGSSLDDKLLGNAIAETIEGMLPKKGPKNFVTGKSMSSTPGTLGTLKPLEPHQEIGMHAVGDLDYVSDRELKEAYQEALDKFQLTNYRPNVDPFLDHDVEKALAMNVRMKFADRLPKFTDNKYTAAVHAEDPLFFDGRGVYSERFFNQQEYDLSKLNPQDRTLMDAYQHGYDSYFNKRPSVHKLPTTLKDYFGELSDQFNAAVQKNKINKDITLNRSVGNYTIDLLDPVTNKSIGKGFRDELQVGDVYKEPGFLSTSLPHYMYGGGKYTDKIIVPGGGIQSYAFPNATSYGQFMNEQEVILPKGLIRRVEDVPEPGQVVTSILNPYKNGGWLDKYNDGGPVQPNYNDASVSVSKDFVGDGYSNVGRNYSPAWGGQFAMGGSLPGSVGFTYARTIGPPAPSNGKYAKKTKASAQNGTEMRYYQEGLDFKPKTISKDGGWLSKYEEGGVIQDDMGQWAHPGEITQIGSNQITMQGVPYPVLGISDTGDTQMMYPNQEYQYDGSSVTEYPMMAAGGEVEDPKKKSMINLSDLTMTPAELEYVNASNSGYCPGGNCLENTRKGYDMTAGRIPGIPSSGDIWTKDLQLISTKGAPGEKLVQENPYFAGDTSSGSADSWDIHGSIVKAGGKNIYSQAKGQAMPKDIAIGSMIGWGPAGTRASSYSNRQKGFNTKYGLQPSHHSTQVVSYNEQGEAIVYDSYLGKYGPLSEIAKDLKSSLGYELENISVPKSVAGNTRENLAKKGLLKNDLTDYSPDINKLIGATDQSWAQIKEDGKVRSPKVDQDALSEFARALSKNKGELVSSLRITNADYDRLANTALALAMTESEGGGALGVSDRFGSTQGMTQLNVDNIKKDARLKSALDKNYKSKVSVTNLLSPASSAIATMMYLSVADKDAKRLYNKGLKPGVRTFDQPGLIEKVRSTNSRLNKDGIFIDELNKRIPYSEIPGYDKEDVTQVNNYLKKLTKSDKYNFVNKDGDLSLKMKTKGNNPKLTDVEKIAYMWQSPNSLKTGDAEGKSEYVNKIKNYYNLLNAKKMAQGGQLKKLDQLTNFTNYNPTKPSGWLEKYQ